MAQLRPAAARSNSAREGRLDVRVKLICLIAASLACLQMGFFGLALLALAVLALGRRLRLQPASGLRAAVVILGVVFLARALTAEGEALFTLGPLTVTAEGIRAGALASLRLALVFSIGALFVATTRSAEIKAGVQWFFRPLPFVPAARLGTMLGLVMRLVPLVLQQAAATAAAQRARAVENRKNPVFRLTVFGIPFLRRVLQMADDLALAMEARAYSEVRTDPELRLCGRDWLFLITGLAVIAGAGFL